MDLSDLEMTCPCDNSRIKYSDRWKHFNSKSHENYIKTNYTPPLKIKEYDKILTNEVLEFCKKNKIKIKVNFN
tara:strand:+ start:1038 stop:1256 length:219 start_codon:yes stop_codon:yes gene_type:complete